MTPHRRVQERAEWGNKKKVGRDRRTATYHRRVARKSSQVGQKSEAEQSRRKDVVRGPLIHDSGAHSSPLERSCSRSNITM